MNALVDMQNLSMTSQDIAALVESRHDKVKQTIERLAKRDVIEFPPMGEISTATKPVKIYQFSGEQGKRDSIIVVAQLCPEFTARLVDRWQELEETVSSNAIALPNFANPAEAARAWADEVEQKEIAKARLEEQAPKVKAFERIAVSDGAMCITDAAKHLQMKPKSLFTYLSGNKWIYKRTGKRCWLAYQNRIQQGLMEHKVTTVEQPDGSEKIFEQVRVTPKGLTKLASLVTH